MATSEQAIDTTIPQRSSTQPRRSRGVAPLVGKPRKLIGNFGNLSHGGARALKARNAALKVASSVVCLKSYTGEMGYSVRSGTIVEWDGMVGTILTSATLVPRPQYFEASDVRIEVTLPDRKVISGSVLYVDYYHNIATISVRSDSKMEVATLRHDPELLQCGQTVVALGRHVQTRDLMASRGKININYDEDLLSSGCFISDYGVGGPLVDISSGVVVGINFKGEGITPFLPSGIVLRCLEHFRNYGKVNRPWLGLKTRALDTFKMSEIETLHEMLPCNDGIFVEKVTGGSPADCAGLRPGDLVTHCEGIPLRSPVEFAVVLLDKGEEFQRLHCDEASDGAIKRRASSVEVVVKQKSSEFALTETKTMVFDRLSPAEYDSVFQEEVGVGKPEEEVTQPLKLIFKPRSIC